MTFDKKFTISNLISIFVLVCTGFGMWYGLDHSIAKAGNDASTALALSKENNKAIDKLIQNSIRQQGVIDKYESIFGLTIKNQKDRLERLERRIDRWNGGRTPAR